MLLLLFFMGHGASADAQREMTYRSDAQPGDVPSLVDACIPHLGRLQEQETQRTPIPPN